MEIRGYKTGRPELHEYECKFPMCEETRTADHTPLCPVHERNMKRVAR